MTKDEKNQNLMNVLGDTLAKHLEENGPVTAAFSPFRVTFPVIDTMNKGVMQLTYNAPDKVRPQLGVFRVGTDRLYSHFLPAAPVEEMIRWLRNPETQRDWLAQIQDLSNSVDDYWD